MSQPLRTFPQAFTERLQEIQGPQQALATLETLGPRATVAWRLNPLRAPFENTLAELAAEGIVGTPVDWCPGGYVADAAQRERLTRAPAVSEGRAFIQDPASWLAALALEPEPGMEVLDLAAAPGGKTSHLAALMDNRGRLAAVEPVRDRFFRLKANLEKLGVRIAALYLKDGRAVGRATPNRFSRVLLDAPCSSESRFDATDESTYAHWSERKIGECARKQRGLLESAFDALAPGGQLVYATCSFAPEENEAVIAHLLSVREHARVVPLEWPLPNLTGGLDSWRTRRFPPEVRGSVRVLPSERMRGFFVARVRKDVPEAPLRG
jgi:16S rRNA (cytosine1407-C5)-methyltransferase